jgi:hypothetical protein
VTPDPGADPTGQVLQALPDRSVVGRVKDAAQRASSRDS